MSAVAHIRQYKTGRFFSEEFRGDLSWNGYEHNMLMRNEGCGADGLPRFTEVAMALGADEDQDARGMASADLDRDGDLDIVLNHNPGDNGIRERGRAVVLRNDLGDRRNWLAVDLVGTRSNRDAVGAVVLLQAGDLKLMRHVEAGSGYASQNSLRLHFGLGDAPRIDDLTVRWPSGIVEIFPDLPVNRGVRIVEGEGRAEVEESPPSVTDTTAQSIPGETAG